MNPDTTPAAAPVHVDTATLREVAGILIPVAITTALTDFLFWDGHFGISVGLFFAALGFLLFLQHQRRPGFRSWAFAALLGATCVQSAIATSLSNVLAASMLSLALAGEVFQPQLGGLWARVSETLYGLLSAPARWLGLSVRANHALTTVRDGMDVTARAVFGFKMLLPALVLLAIFGSIFATGHAVFGDLLQRASRAVIDFWSNLNITPLRVVCWGLFATAALGLFHGTRAPETPRWWTKTVPRFTRADPRLGVWQTAMALLAVNVLFCFVNTLDAMFLWHQSAPPAGVNASEFVHSGVNSLIAAVVLSAVIIAGMFQQSDPAGSNGWLKALAHLWVLQNFVLLASVLRRLMFYTEAYLLTERRVYVACFCALVAVGFLLLAWFVQRRRSFNWLLGQNVVATFALFFLLQFADVAGGVAQYNVARWKTGAALDLDYLAQLGPTAWPELIHVARDTRNPTVAANARQMLLNMAAEHRPDDWRAFQWQTESGYRQISGYLRKP